MRRPHHFETSRTAVGQPGDAEREDKAEPDPRHQGLLRRQRAVRGRTRRERYAERERRDPHARALQTLARTVHAQATHQEGQRERRHDHRRRTRPKRERRERAVLTGAQP